MSKICPNCHTEYDDNHGFCSECGSKLVNKPVSADPALNLGDANAISGGVNINQSKNVTSHDVHYHTIQQSVKPEKEVQQEHYNRYHDEVAKSLKDGIITTEARANLDTIKFQLGLDDATATKIEMAVKNEKRAQHKATNDGLSIIGKMALKSAIQAIEQNSPQANLSIRKLAPICKTTMNEQVHFCYSMLLAAFEPEQCVEAYETRTVDSYWLAYWASMAYRKLGNDGEAEAIISEMTGMWQDRPEINVIINACVGILFANNGDLELCQDLIIEYLTQSSEEPSVELKDLFQALLHLVGVIETDNSRYAFYNEHFLSALPLQTAAPKTQNVEKIIIKVEETKDTQVPVAKKEDTPSTIAKEQDTQIEQVKVMTNEDANKLYEEACKVSGIKRVLMLQKSADVGSLEAMYDLSNCYCDGDGIDKNMSLAIKWLTKSADSGYAKAQVALAGTYISPEETDGLVEQNFALAEKYLLLAAQQGDTDGQGLLSYLYLNTEDYDKAFLWGRKSAQVNHQFGCFVLGTLYDQGLGIEQNHIEGLKWYEKAADAGNADAQNIVGNIYTDADYVEHDYKKAFENYQKAAAQGHSYGMLNLGLCYRDGQGADINMLAAEEWIGKAADAGVQEAIELLNTNPTNDIEKTEDMSSNNSKIDITNIQIDSDGKNILRINCDIINVPDINELGNSEDYGFRIIIVNGKQNLKNVEHSIASCLVDENGRGHIERTIEAYNLSLRAGAQSDLRLVLEVFKEQYNEDAGNFMDLEVACSVAKNITVYYESHVFHSNVLTIVKG